MYNPIHQPTDNPLVYWWTTNPDVHEGLGNLFRFQMHVSGSES